MSLLVVSGGFDTEIFGWRVTTNEPMRPMLIASITISLFILSGGRVRGGARISRAIVGANHRLLVGVMAAAVLAVGVTFATTAASGADSYGYVSQAELWIAGDLSIEQPWQADIPWPSRRWSFAPLGYRPIEHDDNVWAIVPTYSPGLPMLMALAKIVGGQEALFWVVPLGGALLVIATYGIGCRLASSRAGLIGAWLVATSPAFLFMLVWPMTDVPVAAAWALAFYFVLGRTRRSALAAGLAAAVAILIRPNLVWAAGIFGLWYAIRIWRDGSGARMRALLDGAVYSIGVVPGIVTVAVFNNALYGSPSSSGYGSLGDMFSWVNVWPNLRRYSSWLIESQTPVVLAGVAALILPLRRMWSAAPDRTILVLVAAFVAALWLMYCAYLPFDEWWYLRFLLASWPFLMVGVGAVAHAIMQTNRRLVSLAVALAVIGTGAAQIAIAIDRSPFDLWQGERRYVEVAQLVRGSTGENSVILSMQHSGSLRYYGGRLTMRYDILDSDWLDRAVAWLAERGVRSYLLVEEWELPQFRERFAAEQTVEYTKMAPVFIYRGPATVLLYDLQHMGDPLAEPDVIQAPFAGMRSVPPAPPPTLVLTR